MANKIPSATILRTFSVPELEALRDAVAAELARQSGPKRGKWGAVAAAGIVLAPRKEVAKWCREVKKSQGVKSEGLRLDAISSDVVDKMRRFAPGQTGYQTKFSIADDSVLAFSNKTGKPVAALSAATLKWAKPTRSQLAAHGF